MSGGLVILEGPDGAGKTTAAVAITEELRRRGRPSETMAFPGNAPGTLGRLVYQLHHDPKSVGLDIAPHAAGLQLLHAASHLDALHQRIKPALARGTIIVLDRFWWSSIVYGQHAGVDADTLRILEQLARLHWRGIPTYGAFLFMHHRLPHNPDPFWSALRDGYESYIWQLREPFPVTTIDPAATLSEVASRVADLVQSRSPI